MEWISVKDKLPCLVNNCSSNNVLVTDGISIFVAFLHHDEYDEYDEWLEALEGLNIGGVTHWMPLPELPHC